MSPKPSPEKAREYRKRYYEKHKERIRAQQKEYRDRDPVIHRERAKRWREENPDRVKQNNDAYREVHRDRLNDVARERGRVWYAENRERRLAAGRAHYEANKDQYRVKLVRRRARKRGADGFFTKDDIARITEAQGGRCACCGKKRKLSIDHIQPLFKGGSNWPSNIQMLCLSCNKSKRDRDPIEFMQSRGALL